ncbi:hypothetical protein CPB83DRAFT_883515 [Crepidotus variabilis]|uniref:Uncharacterized protein n=1 Tax=Crepidotus variabilis TaxID=179855 RepID=A0A9P6JPZ5_9AGAR|nr:hypothetical protein CPB83DRAFT_883515 [Crepidotus variabilis]
MRNTRRSVLDQLHEPYTPKTLTYIQYVAESQAYSVRALRANEKGPLMELLPLAGSLERIRGYCEATDRNKLVASDLTVAVVKLYVKMYVELSELKPVQAKAWWKAHKEQVKKFAKILAKIEKTFKKYLEASRISRFSMKKEYKTELKNHHESVDATEEELVQARTLSVEADSKVVQTVTQISSMDTELELVQTQTSSIEWESGTQTLSTVTESDLDQTQNIFMETTPEFLQAQKLFTEEGHKVGDFRKMMKSIKGHHMEMEDMLEISWSLC